MRDQVVAFLLALVVAPAAANHGIASMVACPGLDNGAALPTGTHVLTAHCRLAAMVTVGAGDRLFVNGSLAPVFSGFTDMGLGFCKNSAGRSRYFRDDTAYADVYCQRICRDRPTCVAYGPVGKGFVKGETFENTGCAIYDATSTNAPDQTFFQQAIQDANKGARVTGVDADTSSSGVETRCWRKDYDTTGAGAGTGGQTPELVTVYAFDLGYNSTIGCERYNFENAEISLREQNQEWSESECTSRMQNLWPLALVDGSNQSPYCKDAPMKDFCAKVCYKTCGLSRGRHFYVRQGGELHLANLKLKGGRVPLVPDELGLQYMKDTKGGSILVAGSSSLLTATKVVFAGCALTLLSMASQVNECALDGGAIYAHSDAEIKVTSSIFEDTAARNAGGAVYLDSGARMTAVATTFAYAQARTGGGAVFIGGKQNPKSALLNTIPYAGLLLLGGENVFHANIVAPDGPENGGALTKIHIQADARSNIGDGLSRPVEDPFNGGLFIDVCPPDTYKPKAENYGQPSSGYAWTLKGGTATTGHPLGPGTDRWTGCPLSCPTGTSTEGTGLGAYTLTSCQAKHTKCEIGKYKQESSGNCVDMTIKSCYGGHAFNSASATDRATLEGSTKDDGECIPCARGKHLADSAPLTPTCSTCQPGLFANVSGLKLCSPCARGMYGDEVGAKGNAADACKACVKGRFSEYSASSRCSRCPLGFYIDSEGAHACKECPAGKYLDQQGDDASLSDGLDKCRDCGVGFYSSFSGWDRPCIACKTAKDQGAVTCALCPPAKFKDASNGDACKPCASGKYNDRTDQTTCVKCPNGWHGQDDEQERDTCAKCGRGTKGRGEGKASEALGCENCPSGKYSDVDANAGSCMQCPPGRYSPNRGNTKEAACANCPAGKFGSETGMEAVSLACHNCAKGRFGQSVGAADLSACKICPIGFSQADAGSSYCMECAPGKKQPSEGQSACSNCEQNTYLGTDYNPTTGLARPRVACKDCPRERKSHPGAAICAECSPGKHTRVNETEGGPCEPGAQSCEEWGCDACLAGRFQRDIGQPKCDACPAGQVATSIASMTCDRCLPGEYQHQDGQQHCLRCPAGFASIVAGETNCLLCPKGFGSNDEGGSACLSCSKGKFNKAERGLCIDCASGFYQVQEGKSRCEACPAGWSTQGLAGSQSCARGLEPIPLVPTDCAYLTQYLNDSDPDPFEWKCRPCPMGASCAGHINWEGVVAKYGWWRVQFEPGYSGEKDPRRPPDCLVGMSTIDPVCAFSECHYASACLGAVNGAKGGKNSAEFFNGDRSGKGMNLGLNESCNEGEGFASFCDDGDPSATANSNSSIGERADNNRTEPYRTRCRLCARCRPGFKRSGSSMRCKECPPESMNRFFLALGGFVSLIGVGILVYGTVHAEGTRGGQHVGAQEDPLKFLCDDIFGRRFTVALARSARVDFFGLLHRVFRRQHAVNPGLRALDVVSR